MKLDGFRCDQCSVESNARPPSKPSHRWTEVRSLSINPHGWSALVSDGLHYCSRKCLLEAIETKWEKER